MVIQSGMFEIDRHQDGRHSTVGAPPPQDFLAAENVSLRLLLAQAEIDARGLLIASQSLRNVPGAEHAQQAIEGRLMALGRAHDLLLQAQWTSADLGKIVRGATEAFDNPDVPKFTIAGPDVRMTSGAVIAIAMTLNELCTNTTKFGALSVPVGRVDIAWTLDPGTRRLQLRWTESNGPAVQAPEKRSFGTRLIETLGKQLKGGVRLAYEPGGFVYTLDVPLASLTSATAE
jgi:two-component sensor histidine kinase